MSEQAARETEHAAHGYGDSLIVDLLTALRAVTPDPAEPDHAPGCDVFRIAESWEPYGEPRHCDCGFAVWDAKRRGVYNWTPPATPDPAE